MSQSPSIVLAQTVVGALVGSGVRLIAYCPGSRGAPFAYVLDAAERAGYVRVEVFSDERSAGFWAVGASKGLRAAGVPCPAVAVVTTSGTAAAELHPALDEARHRGLPVIAITADRPDELRGVGASQTTDQQGMYGRAVVAADSLPAERDYAASSLRQVKARVRRLLAAALGQAGSPGPVHLNVALREPLVPLEAVEFSPVPTATIVPSVPAHPRWDEVVDPHLATAVIAGDGSDPAVIAAAAARSIPIFAEPTSGAHAAPTRVPFGPLLLPSLVGEILQVVVTGLPTLSRPVTELLARESLRIVVISPDDPWPDPSGSADIVARGIAREDITAVPAPWNADLLGTARNASAVAERIIADRVGLDLLGVCRAIWNASDRVPLWLGASNTVRGFDLAAAGPGPVAAYSNRGLAGIDGTVASAAGLAAGLGVPVRAVMGDLTFAADLSTLTQRLESAPDLQVIVLDDGGGSIFASLEHGAQRYADVYDRYFGVAQRLDVGLAARACGWQAEQIGDLDQLQEALRRPIRGRSVLWIRMVPPAALIAQIRGEIRRALTAGIDPRKLSV